MELQLKDVTKKYGEKVALDRFSYTFRPGIYGILGANGAGKSTMMNLITDNLRRDGGPKAGHRIPAYPWLHDPAAGTL